jgi:hypothetical protein
LQLPDGKNSRKKNQLLQYKTPKQNNHSYDILGAGMLWKPKEARILTNFIDQPVNIGKHSHQECFDKVLYQEFSRILKCKMKNVITMKIIKL